MNISIVIPTKNEEGNIGKLLNELQSKAPSHSAIVVDNSSDNTIAKAESFGATVIKGKGNGLGEAIVQGIEEAKTDVVLVMDADLSHSPNSVKNMLNPILKQGYDMTIGSRYCKGGGIEGWTLGRKIISRVACLLALPITSVRDSTSGFFAFRKSILAGKRLSPSSWKIMLEVLLKADPLAVKEIPIVFTDRQAGKSKFTTKQMFIYLKHLGLLFLHKYQALVKFGAIGLSGAGIHFTLLYLLTEAGVWYIASAIFSIIVASTSNYILNHKITFKDRTISNHMLGWTKYQVISAITDGMYLGLLAFFVEVLGMWYMLGAFVSALIIFPVKFAVASAAIWSKKLKPEQADYEWISFFRGSPIQKWWKQSIAKTVWEWIPDKGKLLDVGCGSSPVISKYSEAIGVDVSALKIAFMNEKLPQTKFELGTAEYLPYYFKKEAFDNIICLEVLEHMEQPERAIAMMASVLKSNGKLVIATPDYSKPLWHIAEFFTPYKEQHIFKFTRKSLEVMCKRHGLTRIAHKYIATCDLVEIFEKMSNE